MIRILSVSTEPLTEVPFLSAGQGAGGIYVDRLPILVATVDRLPDGVAAILATGDLQGRQLFQDAGGGPPKLLGEVLPEFFLNEVLPALELPSGHIGVLLTGDFYTVPTLDRRGGSGDVTDVWRAFGDRYDWVAGVAGNHDSFGPVIGVPPQFSGKLHYLDNARANLDGLSIAGLGGIIGSPGRPWRRSEEQYVQSLKLLMRQHTDILLLHDGPDDRVSRYPGSPAVRAVLERLGPTLVIRGHAHWETPVAELAGGVQVLNVDARLIVLRN